MAEVGYAVLLIGLETLLQSFNMQLLESLEAPPVMHSYFWCCWLALT